MAATLPPLTTTIRVGATSRSARLGEAARYLSASVAAVALDAALLAACTQFVALPVWLAGAIGYFCGLILIYFLSVRWVFAERMLRSVSAEFTLFAGLGIVGLVLNSATLTVATSVGLSLPVAKAISAAIGFVANFVSRKMILFSSSRR